MIELIRKLNRYNPLLWEIRTDGMLYDIYCEGGYAYDDDGEPLYGLTEPQCKRILGEICDNRVTVKGEKS